MFEKFKVYTIRRQRYHCKPRCARSHLNIEQLPITANKLKQQTVGCNFKMFMSMATKHFNGESKTQEKRRDSLGPIWLPRFLAPNLQIFGSLDQDPSCKILPKHLK